MWSDSKINRIFTKIHIVTTAYIFSRNVSLIYIDLKVLQIFVEILLMRFRHMNFTGTKIDIPGEFTVNRHKVRNLIGQCSPDTHHQCSMWIIRPKRRITNLGELCTHINGSRFNRSYMFRRSMIEHNHSIFNWNMLTQCELQRLIHSLLLADYGIREVSFYQRINIL